MAAMQTLIQAFHGRPFRKSAASGADIESDCLYLPVDGRLDAVADSKSGVVLTVPAAQLVTFARTR